MPIHSLMTKFNIIKMQNLLLSFATVLSVTGMQAQNLDYFELKAHYTLVNTTSEALGTWDTIELVNAPLSDTNGVYSFGGYINDAVNEDSSLVITPQLDILNAVQFAVQLEIRMDQLEDKGRPIIVLGEGWRYLGFATGSDSSFQLILNGNYQSGEPYYAKAGQWQTITMMHSKGDSLTSFYVDGTLIYRRKGLLDHPESDTKIMNTHFGNGAAFKGYWRNLKVFTSDSMTSPTVDLPEVKQLNVYPNPSFGSVSIDLEDLPDGDYVLYIYDINGRVVQCVKEVSRFTELRGLPNGILTFELKSNSRQVALRRIIVEYRY
jgi:hypothetical protein